MIHKQHGNISILQPYVICEYFPKSKLETDQYVLVISIGAHIAHDFMVRVLFLNPDKSIPMDNKLEEVSAKKLYNNMKELGIIIRR